MTALPVKRPQRTSPGERLANWLALLALLGVGIVSPVADLADARRSAHIEPPRPASTREPFTDHSRAGPAGRSHPVAGRRATATAPCA
jgi:hypothetical protein